MAKNIEINSAENAGRLLHDVGDRPLSHSPVRSSPRCEAEAPELGAGHAGHDTLVKVLAVVNLRHKTKKTHTRTRSTDIGWGSRREEGGKRFCFSYFSNFADGSCERLVSRTAVALGDKATRASRG